MPRLVVATSQTDQDLINQAFELPSGSQEKFKKRWIEFDCQNGVHHGKWATYENGKRKRVTGGYIGRFGEVAKLGEYATRRIREFQTAHDCHYPERFQKDLEEFGIDGIAVKGWPSGRRISRLPAGGRGDSVDGNSL